MAPTDNPDAAQNSASEIAETDDELILLLVRHGETASNAEGRIQGHRDIPLSDTGRDQAKRLAQRLARAWDRNLPPSAVFPAPCPVAIFTSDLCRASETAHILVQGVPALRAVPLHETPLLRERGFGDWEGLTTTEVHARYGGSAPLWTAPQNPPGSETWADVDVRMGQAFRYICSRLPPGEERALALGPQVRTVMVVGHGGSLRMFLARALGLGPEAAYAFRLSNTSLSAALFLGRNTEQSKSRIILVNDAAHLENE